jgi:hypothetical protein
MSVPRRQVNAVNSIGTNVLQAQTNVQVRIRGLSTGFKCPYLRNFLGVVILEDVENPCLCIPCLCIPFTIHKR